MTNRIPHNLTAIAVLLHAVLGCCSHACEYRYADGMPHRTAIGDACAGRHCHHGQLADRGQSQQHDGHDQQGDHEPCHEQRCHFFSTAETDLKLDFSPAMCLPIPGDAIGSLAPSGDIARGNNWRDRNSPGESLRTQTQVRLL